MAVSESAAIASGGSIQLQTGKKLPLEPFLMTKMRIFCDLQLTCAASEIVFDGHSILEELPIHLYY